MNQNFNVPPAPPAPDSLAQTAKYARKYKNARQNLLLVLVFTLLNLLLLIIGSETMFLFSATVPYAIAMMGSGIGEVLAGGAVIGFAIALVILTVYFLCYLYSRRSMGWMIAALVLFSLDFLLMLGIYLLAFDASGIIDIAFHGWVLYYLISGVQAGAKLKTLAGSTSGGQGATLEQTLEAGGPLLPGKVFSNLSPDGSDSPALRRVDTDAKARILLETDVAGHHICYRRVKRVNELVIDSYVYAEASMFLEGAHTLSARFDGQVFAANFDGTFSYLLLNGKVLAKKRRLI